MTEQNVPEGFAETMVVCVAMDSKTVWIKLADPVPATAADALANVAGFPRKRGARRLTVGAIYAVLATPGLARIKMSFRFEGMLQNRPLVAELQARQTATDGEADLLKREAKGRETWLEYLKPVHAAYMGSPAAGKAVLLARVVRFVLTGR